MEWGNFSVYKIMSFDIYQEVLKADSRIRRMIRETALDHSRSLTKMGVSQVYMKLENLQYTGSFKLRGAMNKILSLGQEEMNMGVVAASSGNHGAAVAYTLNKLNIPYLTNNQAERIQHLLLYRNYKAIRLKSIGGSSPTDRPISPVSGSKVIS